MNHTVHQNKEMNGYKKTQEKKKRPNSQTLVSKLLHGLISLSDTIYI